MVQKKTNFRRAKHIKKDRMFDNKLKVFVKNLPDIENIVDLVKKHFDSCGNILDAQKYLKHMPNEKCTNVCVIFSSEDEAHQATLKTGTLIGGKHLIASRFRQFATPTSSTVAVSNLSLDVTDEDLWQLFEDCGTIKFIRVDREKNATSCQALIYFQDDESVTQAVKLEGKKLNGNVISVGPYEGDTAGPTQEKKEKFDAKLKVYVKNLPDTQKIEDVLKKQFNSCGNIVDVHVYNTKIDGRKYTNAIVVFSSEEEAERATLQTGSVIENRHIIVAKHRQYTYPTSRTVTVTNLSPDCIDEDLWNLFEKCGIKYIHLHRFLNAETSQADLHLKDEAGVAKALKCDGKTLKGNVISVNVHSGDIVEKTYPVFITGLPIDIQKDKLTEEFKDCGIIRRIKLAALNSKKQKQNSETQNATIFFLDEESAEKAVQHSGSSIAGKTYTVSRRQADKANEANYTNPLYIAGISRETKDVDIFYTLQECGLFQKVTFVATPSRFLKKCVVEFKDGKSVKNALALKDVTLHGQQLILSDQKGIFLVEYPDPKACKRPAEPVDESSEPTQKKKKKKDIDNSPDDTLASDNVDDTLQSEGKKKKKKKNKKESENVVEEPVVSPSEISKKKKKKSRKAEVTG